MRAILGADRLYLQREMGISGTLEDIIETTNTKEKDLARAYRILLREPDLADPMLTQYSVHFTSSEQGKHQRAHKASSNGHDT